MQLIPAIVTLFLSLASAGNPNINGATAEGNVNYLISFQDDATADHINGVKEWIKEKEGQVVDTVNESYVKYMVAAMDDKILELNEEKWKNEFKIEEVEVDDFVWDSDDDKLEL